MHTVVDLLDKFILIEQNGYEMFMKMASVEGLQEKIKVMSIVFANEEKRHIDTYKQLKEKMESKPGIEISFDLYNTAANMINEFSLFDNIKGIDSSREMLEFCLNFEKENLALVQIIRSILKESIIGVEANSINTVEELISEEEKHVNNIRSFLK